MLNIFVCLREGVPVALHLHLSPTTEIGAPPLPLTGLHKKSHNNWNVQKSSTNWFQPKIFNNLDC